MHKQARLLAAITVVIGCLHLTSVSLHLLIVPPVITNSPVPKTYFNPSSSHKSDYHDYGDEFKCDATGTQISLAWYVLTNDRGNTSTWEFWMAIDPERGTLISPPPPSAGYYRCQANNSAGIAISSVTHLRKPEWTESKNSKPDVVETYVGSSVVRNCSHAFTNSVPAADNFVWRFSGSTEIIRNGDGFNVDNTNISPMLIIENVKKNLDHKIIHCNPYNSVIFNYLVGSEFQVIVKDGSHDDPRLEYISPATTVVEGQYAELLCVFSSGSSLHEDRISWKFESNEISSKPRLQIPNAQQKDSGVYTCNDVHRVTLTVDELPYLATPLVSQNITAGETVKFQCQGRGRPVPNVTWYKNGEEVGGTDDGVLEEMNVTSSFSVSCNVSNKHGYRVYGAYLLVLPLPPTTTNVETTTVPLTSRVDQPTTYPLPSLIPVTPRPGKDRVLKTSPSTLSTDKSTPGSIEGHVTDRLNQPDSVASTGISLGTVLGIVGANVTVTIVVVVIIICAYRCVRQRAKKSFENEMEMETQGSVLTSMRTQRQLDDYESDDSGVGGDDRAQVRALDSFECLEEIDEEEAD